jgi:hypothetical protein
VVENRLDRSDLEREVDHLGTESWLFTMRCSTRRDGESVIVFAESSPREYYSFLVIDDSPWL